MQKVYLEGWCIMKLMRVNMPPEVGVGVDSGRWASLLVLMPEDHLPTNFLTFAEGAWAVRALRFSAFIIDCRALELVVAVPDKSVSGARAEMGYERTTSRRGSSTSISFRNSRWNKNIINTHKYNTIYWSSSISYYKLGLCFKFTKGWSPKDASKD
jgi:hypothetical protein